MSGTGSRGLAAELVDRVRRRMPVSAPWRLAVRAVPRQVFAPRYRTAGGDWVLPDDPDWLDGTWRDVPLVTATRDRAGSVPAQALAEPSGWLSMLEELDVADGHRLLHIGVGTGWELAVSCHRLGADLVSGVDEDVSVLAATRDRLARIGYRPRLWAADVARLHDGPTGFDRIVAGRAVTTVPPRWLDLLADEGVLVAELAGRLTGSVLALRPDGPTTVTGRFTGVAARLVRHNVSVTRIETHRLTAAGLPRRRPGATVDSAELSVRRTSLSPDLFAAPALRMALQLAWPDLSIIDNGTGVLLIRDDGARLDLDDSGRLRHNRSAFWLDVRQLVRGWLDQGSPALTDCRLTVDDSGGHTLWSRRPQAPLVRTIHGP